MAKKLPLQELNDSVSKLQTLMLEKAPPQQITYQIEKINQPEFMQILLNRHANVHFENWVKSLQKGALDKALVHSERVLKQIRPTANDMPFEEGDNVAVIRYEHGWLDGEYEGVIKNAKIHNGIWNYTVKVTNAGGENTDNFEIEVNHTRDLVAIPGKKNRKNI